MNIYFATEQRIKRSNEYEMKTIHSQHMKNHRLNEYNYGQDNETNQREHTYTHTHITHYSYACITKNGSSIAGAHDHTHICRIHILHKWSFL